MTPTRILLLAAAALAGLVLARGPLGCEPKVQIGPDSGPAVEAAIDANVASPEASYASATSQPATTDVDAAAGRDSKPLTINVSASGSGWISIFVVLAIGAAVVGAVLAVMYSRAKAAAAIETSRATAAVHNVDRALAEYDRLEGNAIGVAKAISKLPPGSHRDGLLLMIRQYLHDRQSWDALLKAKGLRVHSRQAVGGIELVRHRTRAGRLRKPASAAGR